MSNTLQHKILTIYAIETQLQRHNVKVSMYKYS